MNYLKLSLLLASASVLFACKKEKDQEDVPKGSYHIAADIEINESAEVQIAPANTLSEGQISIVANGTQMEGVRSAYIAEANGRIYNLNYGTGVIRELEPNGSGSYAVSAEVDASVKLGQYPRFEVVGDYNQTLLVFYVASVKNADETEVTTTLQIVDYDLPGLNLRKSVEIEIGTYKTDDIYVNRVDAPVVLDGKVYFGTQQGQVGATRGAPIPLDMLQTIVLDYPSLENLSMTTSQASSGQNYGYRGRSMYNYNNAIYQINWPANGSDVVITRLSNAMYDDSYTLNITNKLGGGTYNALNWFHIGNGKGYAAIEDMSIENDNNWFIVYIDIDAQTVEKVNEIPMSDMFYYQNAVVTGDNTFNIAICPVGEDAYIWQINGTTATKGAQLDGGNVFVQGIY